MQYLALLLLLGIFFCNAQDTSYTLQGLVYDLEGNPLERVNVFVKKSGEAIILNYTTTNLKGAFTINTDLENTDLYFSRLGFKETVVPINVTISSLKDLKVQLPRENQALSEVILNVEKAISVKKDTLIFRTKSFEDGTEDTVEDILKNLPGVEVDEKGNIKVNGKSITKVMVEGDDFFGKGYKLLTKNLNARAIKSVEVYKRYSSNKLLKGIEESNKIALNLKLKDDKKFNWFGNVSLGYGVASENRYTARVNLSSFSKNTKFFFLTNLNNLGIDGSGDIADLTGSSNSDNFSSLGNEIKSNAVFSISNPRPYLNQTRQNINNSEIASLNTIVNIAPSLKGKVIAYYDSDDKLFETNSSNRFTLSQETFVNTESSRKIAVIDNLYLNADLNYDINKTATLKYEGKYRQQFVNQRASTVFNEDAFNQNIDQKQRATNHQLTYTNRLSESNVLHVTSNYQSISTPQQYEADRLFFVDTENTFSNIINKEDHRLDFYGLEANFLSKFENKDLFEIKGGLYSSREQFTSNLYVVNQGFTTEGPFGMQPEVRFEKESVYFRPKYSMIGNKFSASASILFANRKDNRSVLSIDDYIERFITLPTFGLSWEINSKNKLTAQYDFNATSNSIDEVNPNILLRDFRSTQQGLTTPEIFNSNGLSVRYILGNYNDKFFMNSSFRYSKNNKYLSSESIATPNLTDVKFIVLDNQGSLSADVSADRYIEKLSLNLKLKGGYSQQDYSSVVNEINRNILSKNRSIGGELKSVFSGLFNFHLGTEVIENESITQRISNKSQNYFSFLDLKLNYKRANFILKTEQYTFKNKNQSSNSFNFMDLQLNYRMANDKIDFSIIGNNLLNTRSYTDLFVSDVNVNSTSYRLIDRYVLMKLNIRF